jgi:hypothetical protein
VQDLANVTVRKGETAELICLAAGDALPHIRFMKTINDTEYQVVTLKEIENRKNTDTISTSIKTEFFKRYLWIYNVTFADAGKYTCKAGNSIGTTRKDMYLIVEEEPIGENRILFSVVRRLGHLVTVIAVKVFLKYSISSFADVKNSCTGSIFF